MFGNLIILFLLRIIFAKINNYIFIFFSPITSMIFIVIIVREIIFYDRIPSTFGVLIVVHTVLGYILAVFSHLIFVFMKNYK
jgi:hypothetical protein